MADFISREAALEAAKAHYPKANEMIAGIILIPAADVRPVVRGKWIEECECTHPQAKCSACGESTLYAISYDIKGNAYYMNFCPTCGAEMINGKEENGRT